MLFATLSVFMSSSTAKGGCDRMQAAANAIDIAAAIGSLDASVQHLPVGYVAYRDGQLVITHFQSEVPCHGPNCQQRKNQASTAGMPLQPRTNTSSDVTTINASTSFRQRTNASGRHITLQNDLIDSPTLPSLQRPPISAI
jgi:hypothetical protein